MSETNHHAEHAWAAEHLEWYLAGGADGDDRTRLEAHIAACGECRRSVEEARAMDARIENLFASARPAPGLEDRMIRAIAAVGIEPEADPAVSIPFPAWVRNLGLLAAACFVLVALGALGAYVSDQLDKGLLPFAGKEHSRGDPKLYGDPEIAEAASAVNLNASSDQFVTQPQAKMELALRDAEIRELRKTVESKEQELKATKDDLTLAVTHYTALSDPASQLKRELEASQKSALSSEARAKVAEATVKNLRVQFKAQDDQIRKLEESAPSNLEGFAAKIPQPRQNQDAPAHGYYRYGTERIAVAGGIKYTSMGKVDPQVLYFADFDQFTPGPKAPPAGAFRPGELTSADPAAPKPESKPDPKDAPATADPAKAPDKNEAPPKAGDAGQPNPNGAGAGNVAKPPAERPAKRMIIRNGEMEFEVESFTTASRTIAKIAEEEGGQVATENSDRLPNGKVRGVVVVRCPPDNLLALTEKLRALGDLKSKRITSDDVTKQYTDLESRLRAARTMEERLIKIIKDGKGEIKDLLLAEKELGVWRTKIEEFQGEMNYLSNQVSMSTLTLTLFEKDIRAAAVATETERVRLGLETEDVEKAYKDALAAIADAKGRVTKSELKKHEAGQFSAVINCEVNPDAAGGLRDRLSQLGKVARLEVDRDQTASDGKGTPELKVKRVETVFFLSLYNLANVAPRETVLLTLAAADAEAAYARILARVEKAAGRVVNSQMARQKNDQSVGTVNFEVKSGEADAVLADLRAAGEVVRLTVSENPDTQNVTKSKRGFAVQVVGMGLVQPRETAVIQLASRDVAAAYKALQEAIAAAKGRVLAANLNEQDRDNISGTLDFEVRRDEEPAVSVALAKAGEVLTRNIQRAAEGENVIDSKLRMSLTLTNASRIQPRETFTLEVEAADVGQAVARLVALSAKAKGTTQNSSITRQANGRVTADLEFKVPLAEASALVDGARGEGTVRKHTAARNPAAPDGPAALGVVSVKLYNEELIIPSDDGVWPQIRTGLATSFKALSFSLSMVVIGVCVVLPLLLVVYAGYRMFRRRPTAGPAGTSPAAPPGN